MTQMPDGTAPTWKATIVRMAAAAVPYVGGPAVVLIDDMRARMAQKTSDFLEDIDKGLPGDLEQLIDAVDQDPAVEYVFVNAFDAALRGSLKAKRRLLAKVVIESVLDSALIDEHTLVVQALRDLDVVHVRALRRLSDEWDVAQTGAFLNEHGVGSGASNVWQATPEAVRSVLVRTGAAKPWTDTFHMRTGPSRQEGISDFGLRLLEQLRQEGLDGEA